jgi:hypothetical protein
MNINTIKPPTSTNKAQQEGVNQHQQNKASYEHPQSTTKKRGWTLRKHNQGGANDHQQNKTSYEHQ